MVSSGESAGVGGVVDSGTGSIVWVRRRNGSWWPGRILGPEDFSASHVMSPRSGTPVKLLGREDASVDWYNLEKSKRVKAFRCGEFDDCIERAEASQGLPAKKREKYARREDAILHALELEKQFIENKFGKPVKPKGLSENSSEAVGALENGNGKLSNRELCQPGRKADKSNLKEKNSVSPLIVAQKGNDGSLEDDSVIIRGSEDFRFKAMPTNRILYSTASEDHAYAVSGGDHCFENSSDTDSKNLIGKGKRLLEGYTEESISKRHQRLHPFVNTRQNSADLPKHLSQSVIYGNGLAGDGTHFSVYTPDEAPQMLSTKRGSHGQMEKPFSQVDGGSHGPMRVTFPEPTASGSSEETESDSSETHSIEPRVEAGMLLSDAETCMRPQSRLTMQAGQESTSSEESDELSHDNRPQFHYLDPNVSGNEVSKWQLKGKRNLRNLGKRPLDKFTQKAYFDARGRPLNPRTTSPSLRYNHDNGFPNEDDYSEDDFDLRTHGFGHRGYLVSQDASARKQSYLGPNMVDWGRPFRGGYWEEGGGCFSPMFKGSNRDRNGHDMLIDVDIQVQANRQIQGEHVPWVSLMSKLNGKAIIGHPIRVEPLKDGSTDILPSTSEDLRYESDRGNVPPVWTTARRTVNVCPKKSPAPFKSGLKKAPKKGHHLPSNQKTKPLSSIGLEQKTNEKDRMIKAVVDSGGPPTVACIPVKLAFSRLLEAVGRPPSGSGKH